MSVYDWLRNVRAGDEVVVCSASRNHKELLRVDRTTATQIIVAGSRFSRKSGDERGGSFYAKHLWQPTPELVAELTERRNRERAIQYIRNCHFAGVPTDVIVGFAQTIKGYRVIT